VNSLYITITKYITFPISNAKNNRETVVFDISFLSFKYYVQIKIKYHTVGIVPISNKNNSRNRDKLDTTWHRQR
jgi:hypothetical protein